MGHRIRRLTQILLIVGLLAGCQGNRESEVAENPDVANEPTVAETAVSPTATAPPPSPTMSPTEPPATTGANADVTFVRAVYQGDNTWIFHVTVRHPDTGWEDYADGWDVVLPNGTVVKPDEADPFTRLLLHPHENEQPFTRSQSGIVIPADVEQVTVRAHDLVDGFGGQEVVVDLTADSGENFEVER